MAWRIIPLTLMGLVLIVLIVMVALWGFVTVEGRSPIVFPGVSVYGVELGGLNAPECLEAVRELEARLQQTPITLTLEDRSWPVELGKLGLRIDNERITSEALDAGRSGFFVFQLLERRQIVREGRPINLYVRLEPEPFRKVIGELTAGITRPPQDAKYHIDEDDTVQIIPHQEGYQVDFDQLRDQVLELLPQGNTATAAPISIPMVKVEPEHVTAEIEAMGLTGLLTEFSTSYDAEMVDRSYNISVAASALNNLLVAPGEVVSFNSIVGPRSSEAGYRTAPVIIENQLQEGLGGGVCQVSTTLYNAVLRANLEIVERKNHSLPVNYVPLGLDATVVYNAVDFKFRNNSNTYVYLKAAAVDDRVTIKVFGDTRHHPRVEIKSWNTEKIDYRTIHENDENLEKGERVVKQAGLPGLRARTERWIHEGENIVKEPLPGSYYQPRPEIIAKGTRDPAPVIIVPTDINGSDNNDSEWLPGDDPFAPPPPPPLPLPPN